MEPDDSDSITQAVSLQLIHSSKTCYLKPLNVS